MKVSAKELKKKIDNNEDFILVDFLGRKSYEARHIPGAINIPVNEIKGKTEEKLPDKSAEIIVYCSSKHCKASDKAYKKLKNMDYKNINYYAGGLAEWQNEGYEFE